MKPTVYIASPYSQGDPGINVRFQLQAWDELFRSGLVIPVAPLWSHFQHVAFPRPYDDWMAYDQAIIERCCDACLRQYAWCAYTRNYGDLPIEPYTQEESAGADREVALFKKLGRPVFTSVLDLYSWARKLAQL